MSEQAGRLSGMIHNEIGDDDDDEEERRVDIIKVKGSALKYVVEFCTYYSDVEEMTPIHTPIQSVKVEEHVQQWYVNFISGVHQDHHLFELVKAANYMDIQPLLQLACFKVAVAMKGLKRDQILDMFHLGSELTEDERRNIEDENRLVR